MTARSSHNQQINFRVAAGAALLSGMVGLAVTFLPGMDLVVFMVTIPALGFLCAGDRYYAVQDHQRLRQSLATGFQWLFIAMFVVFCAVLLFESLPVFNGVLSFMDAHWTSLVMSAMCLLGGIAGLRRWPALQ